MHNFSFIKQPPSKIKISVDFYDDIHRDLLLKSSAGTLLKKSNLPGLIEIPTVDFLVYYLFYKKRPGTIGYSNYREISAKYGNALVELDGVVQFQNDSICATSTSALSTGTTERIGEAIGLSVVSHLHGLVEADWSKIEETTRRKTLDYEFAASDGAIIVKTEAKGSVNDDNQRKSSSISNHKASIEAKKKTERSQHSASSILYGTIAVLDSSNDSVARCWLLDPPADTFHSPSRFRILARLTAISDILSFISPRSQLSAALQTRLAALRVLGKIEALDSVPLRRGDGSDFSTETYDIFTRRHNPLLAGKTRVADGPAGGQVFQLDEKNLLFIGMREDLLSYAITQSFDKINSYNFPSNSVYKHVICSVPKGRFETEFTLGENIKKYVSPGYVQFELEGNLHYSNSGMVFGILPLPEIRDKNR